MINYTSNFGRILDINLIIMIAALVNGIYIGFFEKIKNTKYINFIYFVEVLIYVYIISNNYKFTKIDMYILAVYTFIKSMYFYFIRHKLKIKNIQFISIVTLNIISLIYIGINFNIYISLNILMNLLICKFFILDNMKIKKEKLDENIQKLKKLNENISVLNLNIKNEAVKQFEYKEDTLKIEKNINKSIEESDMPIVMLNEKNNMIYCNQNSWRNINLNKVNILNYLCTNFKNGQECIDMINKVGINSFESINLYDKEEKVYRFICTKEIRENKEIKICIFNDITQSTLIQKQLNDSEEKYRKLMDVLTDGVIIHDMNDIKYINDSAFKILKIENNRSKISLENLKSKIHINEINQLNESLEEVKLGKVSKCINKFKTVDNVFIELITTKIETDDSNILLSIIVDITEMEEALKQLEANQKTYRALAQNLPDGIVVIDKDSKDYVYQNKSMIKILKKVKMDSINKFINDYISNEYYGETKRYEIDKSKSCFASITIIDRKEEQQLLAIVRLLENEERVLEAIKELDLVNAQHHVKNEFLINTSKLLKDPINNVANMNKILEQNKSEYNSKHIENYTKLVKQNCYRLQRVINNMNEIVDVENGVCGVEFVYCDIINLTKHIVDCVNGYLNDKGVYIKFNSDINYSILKIDLDKVQKIILNLISNAIKFSEIGSLIEVYIYKKNDFINIAVKDNGVGIPKDRLKFIFTKFGQVDKTLSRNTEGCGVGLTLVKAFLKLQGGDINVNSEEGKGSEFIISLKEFENIDEKKLVDTNVLKDSIFENMHIEFADIYF